MPSKKRASIYNLLHEACREHGTTLSGVLLASGRSDGNMGTWKNGGFPRVDTALDIAEHLGITLDELCYGRMSAKAVTLDNNEREWLEIIKHIPTERQEICKEFLKTHATLPEKYADKKKVS